MGADVADGFLGMLKNGVAHEWRRKNREKV